jgi:hypothetical protein
MADFYLCPTCDNNVIVGKSCKFCSQKSKSKRKKESTKKPWEQDEIYDCLDLPDDDFDYDKFVADEFGNSDQSPHQKIGIAWYWWLTALILSVIWIVLVI